MARGIWIRQGDQIQGPFPPEKVLEWVVGGRIHAAMTLSGDGETWHPADTALELLLSHDDARSPPPPPPPPLDFGRPASRRSFEREPLRERESRTRAPARE